jgi:hypothetical protein
VEGINRFGDRLRYYFNYSASAVSFEYSGPAGTDILTGNSVTPNAPVTLKPWDLMIVDQPDSANDSPPKRP